MDLSDRWIEITHVGDSGATIHVVPCQDLIRHEENEACVCIPSAEMVDGDYGQAWLYTHHSLDGRENSE